MLYMKRKTYLPVLCASRCLAGAMAPMYVIFGNINWSEKMTMMPIFPVEKEFAVLIKS